MTIIEPITMENQGNSETESIGICGYMCESNGVLTTDEFNTLLELARSSTFIDCLNSDFYNAIKAIQTENEIGIDAKGFGFGDDIKLLNISTSQHVYQFDILMLGNLAFSQGLQAILEGEIVKVIHDCRIISYYLNKRFSVNLQNVFDTAVAELMIAKSVFNEVPKYVCNLPECLKENLGISPSVVWFRVNEKSIWTKRPVSQNLKFAAARDVIFLLNLKRYLLDRMMSPLQQGTNIFLNLVRNSPDEEVDAYATTVYLTPKRFEELDISNKR